MPNGSLTGREHLQRALSDLLCIGQTISPVDGHITSALSDLLSSNFSPNTYLKCPLFQYFQFQFLWSISKFKIRLVVIGLVNQTVNRAVMDSSRHHASVVMRPPDVES